MSSDPVALPQGDYTLMHIHGNTTDFQNLDVQPPPIQNNTSTDVFSIPNSIGTVSDTVLTSTIVLPPNARSSIKSTLRPSLLHIQMASSVVATASTMSSSNTGVTNKDQMQQRKNEEDEDEEEKRQGSNEGETRTNTPCRSRESTPPTSPIPLSKGTTTTTVRTNSRSSLPKGNSSVHLGSLKSKAETTASTTTEPGNESLQLAEFNHYSFAVCKACGGRGVQRKRHSNSSSQHHNIFFFFFFFVFFLSFIVLQTQTQTKKKQNKNRY